MDGFPERLRHHVPSWVKAGSRFHIRIRISSVQRVPLTHSSLAPALLDAARRYHEIGHWSCGIFLLMPDHLHTIVAFPRHERLSVVIRNWKRATARILRVVWQENFFDHRLRDENEAARKWSYIYRNPVVKGLCASAEEWPHRWMPADDGL